MKKIFMKKYSILIWLLSITINSYSQYFDEASLLGDILEKPNMLMSLNGNSFSGNGYSFTPKGDLRILILCVGFGDPYDSAFTIGNWDAAPGSLPAYLNNIDKTLFYSDITDFSTYTNANHNQNVSRFFYEMSHHKLRIMADVYPQRITISASAGDSFESLDRKVFEKMKIMDPSFNWAPYDQRQSQPDYETDASTYNPDNIPDYIIIFYRYSSKMNPIPVSTNYGGFDAIKFPSGFTYNGYTFKEKCGVTIASCVKIPYRLIIHEIAHNLYDCPHYADANTLVGHYFYGRHGWGAMGSSSGVVSRDCMLGWEKWYLNWIENIQANGVNSEINSAADLNPTGQYVLRDFLTTGDVVRIQLPNAVGERNQYLWLENHQNISTFDNYFSTQDGCGNNFPNAQTGVIAYIESINDDRNNPGYTLNDAHTNAIKWLHSQGNFDYGYGAPLDGLCYYWQNRIYEFTELQPNPISGQSRNENIRADFDSSGTIEWHPDYNKGRYNGVMNEGFPILKKEGQFIYGFMGADMSFSAGQELSMSSNPCLVNMPIYDDVNKKMGAFLLNGISVKVVGYDINGNATIKISYNDVSIDQNLRYTGLIHLPNITQNANPDIIIQPNITLSIDKSGTPNRHTKTTANDFINPTEFHCLTGSFFKQEANSTVVVKNGSTLVINGQYEINDNAMLRVTSGSCLQIKQGANIQIKGSGKIVIENGAYLCVEPGTTTINLQNNNSAINLSENAILGNSPNSPATTGCISPLSNISHQGVGSINHLNQDVYIQNETISTPNRHIAGRNIYVGNNVTNTKPQGNVLITGGARVIFDASGKVVFDAGFKCDVGSSFEVVKQ